MTAWFCPDCGRKFARTRQGHVCAPAMSLDEYFASGPAHEKPIFDVVQPFVESLGPVFIEPVQVGIFLKKSRSFAELRPMTKWVALCLYLDRKIDHPCVARKPLATGNRWYTTINLHTPNDVDDLVKEWIAEAYDFGE